ncbi:unnamed protein product [Caenorhabditis brenneri]
MKTPTLLKWLLLLVMLGRLYLPPTTNTLIKLSRDEAMTVIDEIKQLLQYEISTIKLAIKTQLTYSMHRLSGCSDDEHKMRQLCRLRYHLVSLETTSSSKDDIDNAVYNKLVDEFIESCKHRVAPEAGDAVDYQVHRIMARKCDDDCLEICERESSLVYDSLMEFCLAEDSLQLVPDRIHRFLSLHKQCRQLFKAGSTRLQTIEKTREGTGAQRRPEG